jgi:hypothetical protein
VFANSAVWAAFDDPPWSTLDSRSFRKKTRVFADGSGTISLRDVVTSESSKAQVQTPVRVKGRRAFAI